MKPRPYGGAFTYLDINEGKMIEHYDVIVVGGGPAGSSAALILGRSRLKVLLIDKATPRNIRTDGIHGFITRHDVKPIEFRKLAHAEVLAVGVEMLIGTVVQLQPIDPGFIVHLEDGGRKKADRVVVATGLHDRLPDVEGLDRFYGQSVFHCPFCDGWEMRDRPLAVIASAKKAVPIARGLLTWSSDVMVFTNGDRISREDRSKADEAEIPVFIQRIVRVTGVRGQVENIELSDGQAIARSGIFFDPASSQQCTIATELGCRVTRSGAIYTDKRQRTGIDGLYVAGDAAADPNMVAVASADGVKAALNIVQEMQRAGHWLPGSRREREKAG